MEIHKIPKTERDFNSFFTKERKKTVSLLQGRYNFSQEQAEDVYQDSCSALYQNIVRGKLVKLTSTLSTYFTQICIFQALKKKRDDKLNEILEDRQYDNSKVDVLLGLDGGYSLKQQMAMEDIVNHMPPPCDVILWSYYYDNMKMTEIASVIDYKNSDTVKAKKAQCIKKLKDKFSTQLKEIIYGED